MLEKNINIFLKKEKINASKGSGKVSKFYWRKKEERYQYYLERKKTLPDNRRNYYLAHKKQLSSVLKILGMNPALKIQNILTFESFWDLRFICPRIVLFPILPSIKIKILLHQILKSLCFQNPVQTHHNAINFPAQSKSTKKLKVN